ncbi:hypothetical protein PMAYCL1PPCAC_00860, partial [Pristionchus mayeri]
IALFCLIVESRVTFTTSEVLDDVDLKGTTWTSFRCFAGCRVYSPTRNEQITIEDNDGKVYKSLLELSNLKTGEFIELPENGAEYKLVNHGPAEPSFVFYAVEKGAINYNGKVLYVS